MPFGACKLMLMHRTAVLRDDPYRQVEVNYERKVKIPFAMKLMKDFRCCLQYNKTFSRLCLCSNRRMTQGHPVYAPKNESFLRMFQRLGIGFRVVELLYEYFQCIDRDGSGEISLSEFFIFFQMKDTAFARRAFSVMDEDGSGEIDFGEFVLTVWNYATFTKEGLTRFAFELYDADRSGYIDMDEMMMILRQMFGKRYKTNAMANKLMKQMLAYDWRDDGVESNGELQITFLSFKEFCKKHPGLLFPAFHIQMELQQGILGTAFWTEQAKQQEKIKTAQARLKLEAKANGKSFSSNEYTIQPTVEGDVELLDRLNSMNNTTAGEDLLCGIDEKLEEMEVNDNTEVQKAPPILAKKSQESTKTKKNILQTKRALSRSKTSKYSRRTKSKHNEEDEKEKKKKLKEKIKKQLREDRKRNAKKMASASKGEKKTIIDTFFSPKKEESVIKQDDPRRNLPLMKHDRADKKDKMYVVDAKIRKTMIEAGKDHLPWVCLTCHRSNYPDSKRCRTCHARPDFLPSK